MMLHGWKASSDVYLKVSELLSDRYTCISYDCRGHKRSGVTGAPDLSVLAEDLNEVIGKLCTGKPVLIGWSMGGLTALEYIRKYGCEGISGLILVDVAPKMRKDETWPCGTYSDDEFYADQQVMQEIFFAFLRQYYIRPVPGYAENTLQEQWERVRTRSMDFDLEAMKSLWISLSNGDYRVELKNITVPTEIFAAKNKRAVPQKRRHFIKHTLPQTQKSCCFRMRPMN